MLLIGKEVATVQFENQDISNYSEVITDTKLGKLAWFFTKKCHLRIKINYVGRNHRIGSKETYHVNDKVRGNRSYVNNHKIFY